MSRNTKIILGILAIFVLTCLLACVAIVILLPQWGQNLVLQAQDPASIQRIASEIADFTLPPGYQGFMGFDLLGTKMVFYAQPKETSAIMALIQVSQQNYDRAQMEQQLRQQLESRGSSRCVDYRQVGQETLNVKGTPTLFSILECTQRGIPMRQIVGSFQGKGGVAVVLGMGPANRWDQNAFRRFVESIR